LQEEHGLPRRGGGGGGGGCVVVAVAVVVGALDAVVAVVDVLAAADASIFFSKVYVFSASPPLPLRCSNKALLV
jgi:hypothetical protein